MTASHPIPSTTITLPPREVLSALAVAVEMAELHRYTSIAAQIRAVMDAVR